MGSNTNYECDGCGNSIPDPGDVGDLDLTIYSLKNGEQYLTSGRQERQKMDLCPSCVSNVNKAIKRALPLLRS